MSRISPYARIWALVAVWMIGGLSGAAAFAVAGQVEFAVFFVFMLFVVVSMLSYRVCCSECGQPVIYRSAAGSMLWTGVPIWPWCANYGHSLRR
jgi:hypothetical protein